MRCSLLLALTASVATGCYRYSFEQREAPIGEPLVTHVERRPTWLNGLVGTGVVDTTKYCTQPVRTQLKVTATDVLISVVTLLIYTPHTLYVTCPDRSATARQAAAR